MSKRTETARKILELCQRQDALISRAADIQQIIYADKSPFAPEWLRERELKVEKLKGDAIGVGVRIALMVKDFAISEGVL
jgi:hypothetical protein